MAKQTYENYYRDYFNNRCKRINLVLDNEKDADIIKALEGKNISKTVKDMMRKGLNSENI